MFKPQEEQSSLSSSEYYEAAHVRRVMKEGNAGEEYNYLPFNTDTNNKGWDGNFRAYQIYPEHTLAKEGGRWEFYERAVDGKSRVVKAEKAVLDKLGGYNKLLYQKAALKKKLNDDQKIRLGRQTGWDSKNTTAFMAALDKKKN